MDVSGDAQVLVILFGATEHRPIPIHTTVTLSIDPANLTPVLFSLFEADNPHSFTDPDVLSLGLMWIHLTMWLSGTTPEAQCGLTAQDGAELPLLSCYNLYFSNQSLD